MLLPRVQQDALRHGTLQRALRAAAIQEIAAATALQTSRSPACSFDRLRERCRQQGTLPGHAHQRKKGQSATSPSRPLRHAGSLPIRRLLRILGRRRFCAGHAKQYYSGRPIKLRSSGQSGMRLSWLHEASLCARLLPRSLPAVAGERPLAPLRQEARAGDWIEAMSMLFEPTHPNARKDGYVSEHAKVMAAKLGPTPGALRGSAPQEWNPQATTGQRILNYGPAACNHLGAASAT